jgi:hypothetical protein
MEWVKETIELTCKKTVTTGACGGKVTGTLNPPQAMLPSDPDQQIQLAMNSSIAVNVCAPVEDAIEYVHEGQTLTLVAEAFANYEFQYWDGTNCGDCQCSQNTTCILPYAQIGRYTETDSDDESSCYPVFRRKTVGLVSDGDGCCPGTEVCHICATPIGGVCGSGGGAGEGGGEGEGGGGEGEGGEGGGLGG